MAPLVMAVILAFEMGGFISYSDDNYETQSQTSTLAQINQAKNMN